MKAIILILSCLVWMLIFSAVAYSEPYINKTRIEVNAIRIVNPWLTTKVAKRMMRDAITILRDHKIRVVNKAMRTTNDDFSEARMAMYNSTYRFYEEFFYYFLKFFHKFKVGAINHVLAPPWFLGCKHGANGFPLANTCVQYSGGWAFLGSINRGGYSYGTAREYGEGGVPKYRQSVLVIAHELLHTLGAEHINDRPNVMHEDAQGEFIKLGANTLLPILPETIEQVKNVLSGKVNKRSIIEIK